MDPDESETFSVLDMVREFVLACDVALAAEGDSAEKRERVRNRLLWGNPDGPEGIEREAAQARVHDDGDGSPTLWHAVTGTPVAPDLTQPVFGKDLREIDTMVMDYEDVHPLIATCACGEEIMRQAPGEPWSHTDPRL